MYLLEKLGYLFVFAFGFDDGNFFHRLGAYHIRAGQLIMPTL